MENGENEGMLEVHRVAKRINYNTFSLNASRREADRHIDTY